MAFTDYFDAKLALDERTNNVVPGAVAQVYAITDTGFSTPLALTDMTGLPMTTLNAGPNGIYPAFRCEGHTQVLAQSGDVVTPITSVFGVLYEVGLMPHTVPSILEAAVTATEAADRAEAAAERAESGGGGGGAGDGGWLTYTGTAWPTRPATGVPIMWVSTKHATAPQPPGMVIGDMWIRHPDALEA